MWVFSSGSTLFFNVPFREHRIFKIMVNYFNPTKTKLCKHSRPRREAIILSYCFTWTTRLSLAKDIKKPFLPLLYEMDFSISEHEGMYIVWQRTLDKKSEIYFPSCSLMKKIILYFMGWKAFTHQIVTILSKSKLYSLPVF